MFPTPISRLSLKKNKDLFLGGKKYYSLHFTIVFVKANNTSFSVMVSKKTAKLAVNRNKIRRRTSYLFRKNYLSMPTGYYLFIPKSSVLTKLFGEISLDFTTISNRVVKDLV